MRFAGHLAQVVALAKTQVGYVEGSGNRTKYGQWFGWNGVAWCAIYCSWLFAMTGHQLPPLSNSKGVAYVPLVKQRAIETGQWRSASYNPKPGDLVLFWFTNRPDHIETVGEQGRLRDGRVHTYGGNTNYAGSRTGGMCVEAYRRSNIHGFVAVDNLGVPKPPPVETAPEPEQSEEDEDMATHIRLDLPKGSHPHAGRVEVVTAMHRRWVPGEELALHDFLGGKVANVKLAGFNSFTANKEPIGTNPIRGPIK